MVSIFTRSNTCWVPHIAVNSFGVVGANNFPDKLFVTVHMLVPGEWSVHEAHRFAEEFETEIRTALGEAVITTHIEPIEDELSMNDILLEQE